MLYKTFRRNATNWKTFVRARKFSDASGLTLDEARRRCEAFNSSRTPAQIRKGTKLEFTAQ